MSGKGNSSTSPRAFLNYIFFDHEMNYVRAGFLQITTAAQGIGMHQTISLNDIIADREGYILAYLSNENAEEVAIHWDDFTVYHGKTNVVSADSYYPFGMRYSSYQRIASSTNFMNTFQDQEYDEETGWVQFKWRNHMPDIGRFFNIDPLAEEYHWWSTYAFSGNMVTVHRELEGLEPASINPEGTMNYASSTIRYDIPVTATILYDGGSFERSFESDILVGLTPAGFAQDAYDFNTAVSEGDGLGAVLAGVGFIPIVGDGIKIGGKALKEALQAGDNRIKNLIPTERGMQNAKKVTEMAGEIKTLNSTDEFMELFKNADSPIEVIEHERKFFIHNGHHRVEAAIQAGVEFDIPVEVISIDQSRFSSVEEMLEAANDILDQ